MHMVLCACVGSIPAGTGGVHPTIGLNNDFSSGRNIVTSCSIRDVYGMFKVYMHV